MGSPHTGLKFRRDVTMGVFTTQVYLHSFLSAPRITANLVTKCTATSHGSGAQRSSDQGVRRAVFLLGAQEGNLAPAFCSFEKKHHIP